MVSKGFKKLAKGVYGLKAGKKAKAAPVAKPASKPAAKAKKVTKVEKPAAKAEKPATKRTFACPTCKQVFASGVIVGQHYKAEPTHRVK